MRKTLSIIILVLISNILLSQSIDRQIGDFLNAIEKRNFASAVDRLYESNPWLASNQEIKDKITIQYSQSY